MVNASKRYGSTVVLDHLSLDIAAREKLAIIGPSGSGKTTLLRCLVGLERLDAGAVEIDGDALWEEVVGESRRPASDRHVRAVRSKVGMVFQQFNLFPHMTVLENIVAAPIHVNGTDRSTAVDEAKRLLQRVGLEEKIKAYPSQLSGGQQQRVAIARALALRPRLMLFDEVTSALDPELVGEVLSAMRQLGDDGMTMVIVTHEMGFAASLADRVLFMEQGRIVEQGPPAEILRNPREERTRLFLSSVLN